MTKGQNKRKRFGKKLARRHADIRFKQALDQLPPMRGQASPDGGAEPLKRAGAGKVKRPKRERFRVEGDDT